MHSVHFNVYTKKQTHVLPYACRLFGLPELLVAEVSLEKSLECSAVSCFVLCHLVNCVMNGVEVLRLGKLSDTELILACALLGKHSLLNVGLCVPDALSEKFGELCSMLGLLEGIPLEGIGNLRITFPVGLAAPRLIQSF